MKELISEEDIVKIVEKHTKGNYLISKAQAKIISEDVFKRHEEAMKERAIEFAEQWLITNTIDYDDISIEEAYNEKYGSTRQA